ELRRRFRTTRQHRLKLARPRRRHLLLVRRILQPRRLSRNRSRVLFRRGNLAIVGVRRFVELWLFKRRRFVRIAEGRTQTIARWGTIRAASRRTARSG